MWQVLSGITASLTTTKILFIEENQTTPLEMNEAGEVVVPLPARANKIEADRKCEKARWKRERVAAAMEAARENAVESSAARHAAHTASTGKWGARHRSLTLAVAQHERYRDTALDAHGQHEPPSQRIAHSAKFPFGTFNGADDGYTPHTALRWHARQRAGPGGYQAAATQTSPASAYGEEASADGGKFYDSHSRRRTAATAISGSDRTNNSSSSVRRDTSKTMNNTCDESLSVANSLRAKLGKKKTRRKASVYRQGNPSTQILATSPGIDSYNSDSTAAFVDDGRERDAEICQLNQRQDQDGKDEGLGWKEGCTKTAARQLRTP